MNPKYITQSNIQNFQYHLILRPEPEGGFSVFVPALPGCITYGRTVPEAKEMATDAIKGYITSLKKHNEPIPTDEENIIASVLIQTSRRRKVSLHA